jgi:hypothetical protein
MVSPLLRLAESVRGHIMKIKFAILLFLGTLQGFQSLGQYIRLSGIVQTSSEPIAFAILTLKNMAANTQFVKVTDYNGSFQFDSLVKGNYRLTASFKGFEDYLQNDLVLFKDSLNNRITLKICDPKYPITKCPVCNQSNQVIRVGNDGILETKEPWGEQQQEYKFPRKVRKYGYETYYFEGQELLYYIVGENSTRLYSGNTLCDCLLFCKKDKNVFKSYAP